MKIIDLLNKLANGEELPNLKLEHSDDNDIGYELYMKIGSTDEYNFKDCLNEEIEIIEEDKKIEHIYYANLHTQNIQSLNEWVNEHFNEVYNKIYELIDEVNKSKEVNNE